MTEMTFQVRRSQSGDIPALMELIRSLAAHHGDEARATPASLFANAFGPAAVVQILVAETDGLILGYCALVPLIQLQHGARGFDLHHLFVDRAHRGQGIGRALIGAAKALACQVGAVYLTVRTTVDNTAAQEYYLSQGAEAAPVTTPRFRWVLG